MDPHAIDRRVKSQRLKRLHTGVYLVGAVTPPLAREMAAEEREHVALVGKMLGETPEPMLDTTLIFES